MMVTKVIGQFFGDKLIVKRWSQSKYWSHDKQRPEKISYVIVTSIFSDFVTVT